jgi:hypothetical protein
LTLVFWGRKLIYATSLLTTLTGGLMTINLYKLVRVLSALALILMLNLAFTSAANSHVVDTKLVSPLNQSTGSKESSLIKSTVQQKYWAQVLVGEWVEAWVLVCGPDRGQMWTDWDCWYEPDYVYVEYYIDVWVDDPDDCESGASTKAMQNKSANSTNLNLEQLRLDGKVALGSKPTTLVDYDSPTSKYLSAVRSYNPSNETAKRYAKQNFGEGWFGKWDRSINLSHDNKIVVVTRGDGTVANFYADQFGNWIGGRSDLDTLIQRPDGTWLLKRKYGHESYNQLGKLEQVVIPGVANFTLSYYGETGLLRAVSSSAGGTLEFQYDTSQRVKSVSNSTGAVVLYSYTPANLLDSVVLADGTGEQYKYSSLDNGVKAVSITEFWGNLNQVKPEISTNKVLSCPAPCTPQMRSEIQFCKWSEDLRATSREQDCQTADYQRRGACTTEFLTYGDNAKYNACLASSATYLSLCLNSSNNIKAAEYARCDNIYPQCK